MTIYLYHTDKGVPATLCSWVQSFQGFTTVSPTKSLTLRDYSLGPFNNYIYNGVAKLDPRTGTVKIDHNLNEKLRL